MKRGRIGAVAQALAAQAAACPGTVRELAARAQVGNALARCTASRMAARGELVPMGRAVPRGGLGRVAVVYGARGAQTAEPGALATILHGWAAPARVTTEPAEAPIPEHL